MATSGRGALVGTVALVPLVQMLSYSQYVTRSSSLDFTLHLTA